MTFTLPNGSKITSLRESTLRSAINAANAALKEELRTKEHLSVSSSAVVVKETQDDPRPEMTKTIAAALAGHTLSESLDVLCEQLAVVFRAMDLEPAALEAFVRTYVFKAVVEAVKGPAQT